MSYSFAIKIIYLKSSVLWIWEEVSQLKIWHDFSHWQENLLEVGTTVYDLYEILSF